MPDADPAAAAAAPAGSPQAPHPADKDRVGEELGDDARIWRIYDQIARADDKDRIDTWNRGLDNLALFAGLFSAVTTAFIIEAQKDMKVDYSQLTFLALNATANGVPFVQQLFIVPASARTITCLWVASLVLSLSAALIAIMGKDWIGLYSARPVCNARQWTEMRTYRLLCVERWYMSEVIASAPVLLHVSLLLFGAGLVLFISPDRFTHHLTLGLALAAGALYLVTALSAVVFPASPFKSPATQMIRAGISALFNSGGPELLHSSPGRIVGSFLPWTDVRPSPSVGRLAKALSWLSGASQAPDVLRDIIVALGDLEIGNEVAPLVSSDLRIRIRADIRFNWKKVDFLTLARYVLADRNLSRDPLLSYHQFIGRFDMQSNPNLHCEDGLAAAVVVAPDHIRYWDLQPESTLSRAVRLFGLFTHSETRTKSNDLVSWDLGDYLREKSSLILEEPSAATAIRRLLVEPQAIYPRCHGSDELLAHWKRIGLSGEVQDWSFETDAELAAFLSPCAQGEGDGLTGVRSTTAQEIDPAERDALWWINVCMG
ncbi:hypothetical protein AURDEDRAFT_159171 [Auricularia subglabra TFB-10046 SS5]|nr:hypothetical protein AURDEDRAFT_159171 [Auricularia subglabra TFB-10046 SS5]